MAEATIHDAANAKPSTIILPLEHKIWFLVVIGG
jgi:hypothetical protein